MSKGTPKDKGTSKEKAALITAEKNGKPESKLAQTAEDAVENDLPQEGSLCSQKTLFF